MNLNIGGFIDNALGTNIFGDNSTDKAINAQTSAANQSNATQKYIFDQTRKDQEPWRQSGMRALAGLENNDFQRDFTINDYQKDPGYQFRLDEGNKAINAAAAARGMGNSGATMKALARYGQDYATNEYQNAYNRFNADRDRRFNRFSSLAGIGQTATNQVGLAGQNYGNNVSNTQMGLGNAIANAEIAKGNQQRQFFGQVHQTGGMLTGMSGGGGANFCDERLKTNIKPVPKEYLEEMKPLLKAFAFNYVSDEYGKGEWIGPMAQDLEKSKLGKTLIFEDKNGFKKIDMNRLLLLFLATMAEG